MEENIKYELSLTNEKAVAVSKRFDKNWFLQLSIILFSFYIIQKPGSVNEIDLILVKLDSATFKIIVPFVLTYFFIRFGYSLSRYYSLRKQIDFLINKNADEETAKRLQVIFSNDSLIEMLYEYFRSIDLNTNGDNSDKKKKNKNLPITAAYALFLLPIIYTNHVLSIYFTLEYLPTPYILFKWIVAIIISATIFICYWLYGEKAQSKSFKNMGMATLVISIILVIALHIFF